MALLRRHTPYTILSFGLLYFLYSLNVPYEESDDVVIIGDQESHVEPVDQLPPPSEPEKTKKYESFNWAKLPLQNPVESPIPIPTGKPRALPRIQFEFGKEDDAAKKAREAKKDEIKDQFHKCWLNYQNHAWMHDEMRPISGNSSDHFGGWATTLVDSLDTLYIMGWESEFASAVKDVEGIDFGYTDLDNINVFETTIRLLGGLLSAFELSGDTRLLKKAKEAGEMLYHAFDTPNHMPITRWQFRAGGEGKPQVADPQVLLAEIGSMTLELTRLSQLTGDSKWYDAVTRISRHLEKQQDKTKLPGMWPLVVNARDADFTLDVGFTLGSMSDSTYEYLSKQYMLLGGQDESYRKMYLKAMDTATKHLLFRPMNQEELDILVPGFLRADGQTTQLDPVMQHLTCYTGGMFALGGKLFDNKAHIEIGRKITQACAWAYQISPSGIMPESSHLLPCTSTSSCPWDEAAWKQGVFSRLSGGGSDPTKTPDMSHLPAGFTSIDDRRYALRPEAIESVFIMYRITGEPRWQAIAWEMWLAVLAATDTDLGNSALSDVSADLPPREDSMESFWMAKTLKYFYLIFSEPDYMSLDGWVFTTEAHLFKIPKATH